MFMCVYYIVEFCDQRGILNPHIVASGFLVVYSISRFFMDNPIRVIPL